MLRTCEFEIGGSFVTGEVLLDREEEEVGGRLGVINKSSDEWRTGF